MIKNFDTVKSQLADLAGVINSFKSEAVQLRIIELVLGNTKEDEPAKEQEKGSTGSKKDSHQKKNKRSKPRTMEGKKPGKSVGGSGAVATLMRIATTDFFSKPRTINDIIDHCKNKYARNFKANEFSGKLGRMVRNGELTRQKNTEKQYEYKKP